MKQNSHHKISKTVYTLDLVHVCDQHLYIHLSCYAHFYRGCDWWEKGGHQSFYEVWRSRYLSELREIFVEPLKELDQIHDIVMEIISILLQKTTTKIITKCEWNSLHSYNYKQ